MPENFPSLTFCCLLSSPRLQIYPSPALITLSPANLSTGNNMFTLHNKFRTCLENVLSVCLCSGNYHACVPPAASSSDFATPSLLDPPPTFFPFYLQPSPSAPICSSSRSPTTCGAYSSCLLNNAGASWEQVMQSITPQLPG